MGSRGPDWSHEETLLLVQMKKEAVLSNKKEGGRVWTCISTHLYARFNRARSESQCRRRWDTLKKVYKKIEEHCVGGSEDAHRHLDRVTLDSMELATAYHEDWYTIFKQVCLTEEGRQKKRKRSSCANTQGIRQCPPTNNNNNPRTHDQAVIATVLNAHEAIWSPTVDAQSSSTEAEKLKFKIECLEALVVQQKQQILQLIQQQRNSQAQQMISWPLDQLDLKPEKNFNMPLGDSAGLGKMTEYVELPSKCFSPEPLPSMEGIPDLDLWRIILQFVGQRDSNNSATNLSIGNPALFGRQSMPQFPSPSCDGRETTLTINARFTIKATQMVSSSNHIMPRTLHPDHEKPASIDLQISTGANAVAEYYELLAELQRLKEEQQQQQLWNIQQSQVSKPVTIYSSSESVSDEKPFNPQCAAATSQQPTTDDGLTQHMAQMSLTSSKLLAHPTTSQLSMDLPNTILIPSATLDNSSPAGLHIIMNHAACNEVVLGHMSATDWGIHKSSSVMV